MPGLLGALLAGGVAGGAEADNKNVATQNQQAIAENTESAKAGIEDMYAQARENRQYALAGRFRNEVVAPVMQHDVPLLLNAQNKAMPGEPITQEQKDAGRTTASMTDVAQAQGIALSAAGLNSEITQKGGIDIANAEDKFKALVQGMAVRGTGAAQINSDARNYATDTNAGTAAAKLASQQAIASARLGTLTPGEAVKLIGDPLAPPDTVAIARKVLTGGNNGALNSGVQPAATPSPAPGPVSFSDLPLR